MSASKRENTAVGVVLRVPPSIAKDYECRSVFAALRIAGAAVEGAVTYRIPVRLAAKVLADARIQHARPFTGVDRGTKKSYGHIVECLRAALEPKAVEQDRVKALRGNADVGSDRVTVFRAAELKAHGLEVRCYGEKLLNAYGSQRQLVQAGLVAPHFEFPVSTNDDNSSSKRWEIGQVHYHLSRRHKSGADQRDRTYRDHWWFQVNDQSKAYPDDFVAIHKSELKELRA